jgi:phage shock protein E
MKSIANCPSKDKNNESADCWLKNGAILLDVRTRKEYCQGHIPDAIYVSVPIPHPQLTEREVATLKDQLWYTILQETRSLSTPIVVYCRKGIRAELTRGLLHQLGYKHVLVWGGVEEEPLKSVFADRKNLCLRQANLDQQIFDYHHLQNHR